MRTADPETERAVVHLVLGRERTLDGLERPRGPPACTGMHVKTQLGNPDLAKTSTSYIERQNPN